MTFAVATMDRYRAVRDADAYVPSPVPPPRKGETTTDAVPKEPHGGSAVRRFLRMARAFVRRGTA